MEDNETQENAAGRPFGAKTSVVRWTNSSWQYFKDCPCKFNLKYELGVRPAVDPIYFRVGNAVDKVLAPWYRNPRVDRSVLITNAALGLPDDEKERFKLMMEAYFEFNPFPAKEEDRFFCELKLIATLPETHKVELAGSLDVLAFKYSDELRQYRLLIVDHKTSSKRSSPGDRNWNPQLYTYRMLWELAMKEPGRVRSYSGKPFSDFLEKYGNLLDRTLNPHEPALANNILVKSKAAKPKFDETNFEFVEVPEFHDKMIQMVIPNMIDDAQQVREYRKEKRWPKNPHHCIDWSAGYSRKCQYWDFCVGGDESSYRTGNPWEELEK